MIRSTQYKSRSKLYATIFVTALIVYFIYHVLSGNRGVIKLFKLQKESEVLQSQMVDLGKEKSRYEKNVEMMKSGAVNKDMLDEQVRENLGYVGKNEKVYSYNKN